MLDKLKLAARWMVVASALTIAALLVSPSRSSQGSCVMPTSGTVTGLTLVNDINACNQAILSVYSGASAPGSPTTNMLWLNDSTHIVQQYDGTNWINLWSVDATNHLIAMPIGGGVVTGTLTSATTTDIGSLPQPFVLVNLGASPITSFGSSAIVGSIHVIQFNGIMTLTHNATSLILPGGQPILTAVGDNAFAMYLGGGNWRVLSYNPASGTAVTSSAVPLGTVLMGDFMTLPPKTVYGAGQSISRATYPGYTAAVSRTQSMTRASGNATLTAVSDTSGMGAGMPVEGAGISTGCTIASVIANTSITLNNSTCVSASGSTSITVFGTGYGIGGDSTTVGVKNCKGKVIAGRDDMLGTAANNLTASYFGGNASALNAFGGGESLALLLAQLPTGITSGNASQAISVADTLGRNIPATSGTIGQIGLTSSGALAAPDSNIVWGSASTFTGNNAISTTSNNTSGLAHRTVQPTVIAQCVVVVTP